MGQAEIILSVSCWIWAYRPRACKALFNGLVFRVSLCLVELLREICVLKLIGNGFVTLWHFTPQKHSFDNLKMVVDTY